jgi:hypothetical protein
MVCSYTVSMIFFHISDYHLNEMDNIFIEHPKVITENVRLKCQKVVSEKRVSEKSGFWKKKKQKNELAKMDTKCSQKLAFCIWELKNGKTEIHKIMYNINVDNKLSAHDAFLE